MLETWIREVELRKPLLKDSETLRVVHINSTPLRADKLGDVLSAQWFADAPPSAQELEGLEVLAAKAGCKHWFLRWMINRGKDPNTKTLWKSSECPDEWMASESSARFCFRLSEGTSPGLFLDQRPHRKWLQENAKGRSVLNLFAYTGGFSVVAALGGAREVVTVDLSANYIDWTKSNFTINNLDTQKFEFWAADSFDYLRGAAKRDRKFDIIICDPPSFSRSKKGIFRVEKNYEDLLSAAIQVLSPQGRLFFSTNFEGWSFKDFKKQMETFAQKHPESKDRVKIKIERFDRSGLDFEPEGQDPTLKVCIFRQ